MVVGEFVRCGLCVHPTPRSPHLGDGEGARTGGRREEEWREEGRGSEGAGKKRKEGRLGGGMGGMRGARERDGERRRRWRRVVR